MNRLIIASSIVLTLLVGCVGTSPTAAPTAATTAAPVQTSPPAPTQPPAAPSTPTPEPTSTSSPVAPEVAQELPPGVMEPGTYFGESEDARYTFTIPAPGWNNYPESGCCTIYSGGDSDGAIIFFAGDITSLYAEACHSEGTEFDFGPTVDDLADALVSLEDFEVSEPTDVTLSGFHGKRVKVTVPMDVDTANPDCYRGNYSLTPGRSFQAPGQTDDNWILDVDGSRMVPAFATTPDTPADVLEQVELIRDSLVIEPI